MTNILWFHEIGMADVPQVGGKNASLGEMVSNLSDAGVSVPGGFATTADAYREFLAADGLYERIRSTVEALDVTDVAELARVGANVREWIEEQPLPAAFESDIRARVRVARRERPAARDGLVGGAVQRDGGGPAGCLVRGSAGDVPEHQRDREHPRRDPQRVRVAVQRPGDRVPGAPRLRPPRRGAVGGDPADGAIGCRRLRRPVHRRHRIGVRPGRVHHELVRARRGGRAGGGEPGRVLRLQAGAAGGAPGDPEAVGGGEGAQDGLRRRHPRRREHRVHRRRRWPIARSSASPMPRSRSSAGRRS